MVDAATGGVLGEVTVDATAQGYAELVEFANNHATLRAWAIEGTGGHGAGLSRHLLESSELVIELDRPKRAARRNGAKSDPLDAIRAAREAMGRPRLGSPRSGGERRALSVLLAARRSAIHASTEAQQQVFSLVIAAPEPIRARFRGQKLAAMLNTAAKLRVQSAWDVETTSTVVALRALARRAHAMLKEARELQKAMVAIIRSWRPELLEEFGVGPIVAAAVLCAWSHPGRIHSEAAFAMLAGVAPIPANSGQGHHPSSAQPLRRPAPQPGPAHRGTDPHPVPGSHPRLRRPTRQRRQDQPRDQTMPSPPRRPRPVPPPRKRGRHRLTKYRSVAGRLSVGRFSDQMVARRCLRPHPTSSRFANPPPASQRPRDGRCHPGLISRRGPPSPGSFGKPSRRPASVLHPVRGR
ncbi:MAG TPA: transposase [Mycobacterium sp.]|nr:transposase [Mycobacterium sp.]